MTRGKRSFGYIRLLPSKRYQASYIGPDSQRHSAPETFTAKMDAEGWLSAERRLIEWDQWTSPEQRAAQRRLDATQTLKVYVEDWLPQRVAVRQLKPKTESEYKRYLSRLILPALGDLRLKDISPATVRSWLTKLNPKTPRLNEHAYALLKEILATAVEDELLDRNPCREHMKKPIRHIGEPATLEELAKLVEAMPERLRLMIELAAWCALRFGEVAELRRGDIDLTEGVIRVRRAVQWIDGVKIVAAPKADSVRVVAFPPHIGQAIKEHLEKHAQWGKDGLLFPTTRGGQYRAPTFHSAHFRKAREAAGRPDRAFTTCGTPAPPSRRRPARRSRSSCSGSVTRPCPRRWPTSTPPKARTSGSPAASLTLHWVSTARDCGHRHSHALLDRSVATPIIG